MKAQVFTHPTALRLKTEQTSVLCSIIVQFSCLRDWSLTYIGMSTRHLSTRANKQQERAVRGGT